MTSVLSIGAKRNQGKSASATQSSFEIAAARGFSSCRSSFHAVMGRRLALKLVTYRKNPPPSDWVLNEDKSLSLNESEGRQLLAALRDHLAVAESDQDGRYILIRVDEGTANFGDNDPIAVAAALAKVLSQDEIVQHLAATELTDSLLNAFRGAIRLKEMRSAVAELRKLLDSYETNEQLYQAWCKQHSWAFGNAYLMSDSSFSARKIQTRIGSGNALGSDRFRSGSGTNCSRLREAGELPLEIWFRQERKARHRSCL